MAKGRRKTRLWVHVDDMSPDTAAVVLSEVMCAKRLWIGRGELWNTVSPRSGFALNEASCNPSRFD